MERLSFIDQLVHKISTSGLPPVNMQGAMIIDPNKSPFDVNAMIIAEHIVARLSKFPLLRKKLVQDPLKVGDLRMVDDEDFDPWNHVTFATLPTPGDKRALERHMGKFSAQNLDNDIPLWQFEIIEGLEGGKIAIIQKLSHATMDGMAAINIMQSLFDPEPIAPSKLDKNADYELNPEPDSVELLTDAVKENIERIRVNMPKTVMSLSKVAASAAKKMLDAKLADEAHETEVKEDTATADKPTVCKTSLNGSISSDKRIMTAAKFELDQFKALAKAHNCTINDICLTMASQALANYFAGTGEAVDDLYFVMPISTRGSADKAHGNALALSRVNAHNSIGNITERLQAIHADTQEIKTGRSSSKSGMTKIEDPTAMLSPILLDAITQVLHKANPWDLIPPIVNAVMTNVPGSRHGLFFAGMPIDFQIPIIPVFHKSALSVGATSMGNVFSFGFHACGKVVKEKNKHLLTDGLQAAYDALVDSAPATPKQAVASKPKQAPAAKAPAKKAPKKKAIAKKAPAKKAVSKKAPAKKAAAKKAVAKKPVPKKKKVPAKKPAAKKAPKKKAVTKTAPKKKAPVKKASK